MAPISSPRRYNRRKTPRVPSDQQVQVRVIDPQIDESFTTAKTDVLNVSGGGMALFSSTPVPVGSHVSVSVTIGNEQDTEPDFLILEVVDCTGMETGEYVLRCRLKDGDIPAEIMLNW